LFWSLFIVLLVALPACKSNSDGNETPPATEASLPTSDSEDSSPDESSVELIIASINPNQPDTYFAPEELVALGHDAVPELIERLESPDVVTRWAAVYALTRLAQPEDIPGLVQGLDDPNLSNRAGIAATLLWLGDDRGLPVLEEALLSDEQMLFSHPPERVSDYARKVLKELHPESLSEGRIFGSKVLASKVNIPPRDVSVSKSGCTVEIELNLQFSGAGATEALASIWKQGILDMWDGKKSTLSCETSLTVNTLVGGAPDPNYAQINVVLVPPGGYHPSENSLGGTVSDGTANDVFGNWASNDGPAVAAHEAGHAMGVDDEYVTDADGYAVPAGEAVGEADGAGVPGIMAQTWEDDENQVPEAKPRHIDSILQFYEIECVCCGLVEWDASYAGFSFTGNISTCDGTNWHGELTEILDADAVSAQAFTEFDFVIEDNANAGETEFVAEGNWTTGDVVIPFQDNITFRMILSEGGSTALLDMFSNGGVLLMEGMSVPVPQAMPATTGELSLPILPNPVCQP
jgi:hypothetical protein